MKHEDGEWKYSGSATWSAEMNPLQVADTVRTDTLMDEFVLPCGCVFVWILFGVGVSFTMWFLLSDI